MDPTLTAMQAAAVVGTIEIAKARGLDSRYAAILSPFVGAAILALYALVPAAYDGALNAVLTGLAATGGYGLVSAMAPSTAS